MNRHSITWYAPEGIPRLTLAETTPTVARPVVCLDCLTFGLDVACADLLDGVPA